MASQRQRVRDIEDGSPSDSGLLVRIVITGTRRLGLVMISTLGILVLLEVLVRIFLPQQTVSGTAHLYQPDDKLGWRHASNLDTSVNMGEGRVRFLTDEHGHRVGTRERKDPAYRVLALGDSFVAAREVEYDETMTARLEELASESTGETVTVVNTGVGGWGPNHYLLEARKELARADYDLVLVFVYMENDIVAERVASFPLRQKNEPHKFYLPRSLKWQEIVDAILRPINDFLEGRSHLFILVRTRLNSLRTQLGLSPYYLPDTVMRASAGAPMWAVTADIIADIGAEAAGYDVPVVVVLLPPLYQVDVGVLEEYSRAFDIDLREIDRDQPSRLLLSELGARGLEVVDPSDVLRDAHEAGVRRIYGRVDRHFQVAGHKIVAEYLASTVVAHLEAAPGE